MLNLDGLITPYANPMGGSVPAAVAQFNEVQQHNAALGAQQRMEAARLSEQKTEAERRASLGEREQFAREHEHQQEWDQNEKDKIQKLIELHSAHSATDAAMADKLYGPALAFHGVKVGDESHPDTPVPEGGRPAPAKSMGRMPGEDALAFLQRAPLQSNPEDRAAQIALAREKLSERAQGQPAAPQTSSGDASKVIAKLDKAQPTAQADKSVFEGVPGRTAQQGFNEVLAKEVGPGKAEPPEQLPAGAPEASPPAHMSTPQRVYRDQQGNIIARAGSPSADPNADMRQRLLGSMQGIADSFGVGADPKAMAFLTAGVQSGEIRDPKQAEERLKDYLAAWRTDLNAKVQEVHARSAGHDTSAQDYATGDRIMTERMKEAKIPDLQESVLGLTAAHEKLSSGNYAEQQEGIRQIALMFNKGSLSDRDVSDTTGTTLWDKVKDFFTKNGEEPSLNAAELGRLADAAQHILQKKQEEMDRKLRLMDESTRGMPKTLMQRGALDNRRTIANDAHPNPDVNSLLKKAGH